MGEERQFQGQGAEDACINHVWPRCSADHHVLLESIQRSRTLWSVCVRLSDRGGCLHASRALFLEQKRLVERLSVGEVIHAPADYCLESDIWLILGGVEFELKSKNPMQYDRPNTSFYICSMLYCV